MTPMQSRYICAEKIKQREEEGKVVPNVRQIQVWGLGTNHPSELGKFQHLDLELKAEVVANFVAIWWKRQKKTDFVTFGRWCGRSFALSHIPMENQCTPQQHFSLPLIPFMFSLTIWNPECGVYIALASSISGRDRLIIAPLLHGATTISQENPEQIPDVLPHEEKTKKKS